MAWELNKLNF